MTVSQDNIKILGKYLRHLYFIHFKEVLVQMEKSGQPIIIVDPRKERTKGKEALSTNIAAAKAVASIVRSTLGPRGMDKMLINPIGDITITNDGATILHDMSIEHPAAKMVVEVAESLEAPLNADDTADVGPDAASAPGGLAK